MDERTVKAILEALARSQSVELLSQKGGSIAAQTIERKHLPI